jgi:tRNA-binding protein
VTTPVPSPAPLIDYNDFTKVDIRVGIVTHAQVNAEARKAALKLTVDFGPVIGTKKTSAQITQHYTPENLIGTRVCAVVNFPPKQIGSFISEVLVLGFPDDNGHVVLIRPDHAVPIGGKLF